MKRLVVGLAVAALLWPMSSGAEQPTSSTASEFGLALLTPLVNVVYFPVKLAVGVVGAALGGISGWATGGDERAAEGIWRPMTGGTYWITPGMMRGETQFMPLNGESYTSPSPPPSEPGLMPMRP
jgi:hypothetical protein